MNTDQIPFDDWEAPACSVCGSAWVELIAVDEDARICELECFKGHIQVIYLDNPTLTSTYAVGGEALRELTKTYW